MTSQYGPQYYGDWQVRPRVLPDEVQRETVRRVPTSPHEPTEVEAMRLTREEMESEALDRSSINSVEIDSDLDLLASRLAFLGDIKDEVVEHRLTTLGGLLRNAVMRETPRSSGRLARSTKYRIREVRPEYGGLEPGISVQSPRRDIDVALNPAGGKVGEETEKVLQIIQDATAHTNAVGRRYYYWYSVNKGSEPQGSLVRHYPPYANLVPWVRRSRIGGWIQSEDEIYETARYLSKRIYDVGITPNPYLARAYRKSLGLIQSTADDIGKELGLKLGDLPSVQSRAADNPLNRLRRNPRTTSMINTFTTINEPQQIIKPYEGMEWRD